MSEIYSPPYDSPIEDAFALHYARYSSDVVELISQYRTDTLCGRFIVDFVIEDENGYRIGIECDGKEFHDDSRDEWRDAMILGEGHLDVIYRLRGGDIRYCIEDVLYLLAELEPSIFGSRAVANLKVLASSEIQQLQKNRQLDSFFIQYRNGGDAGTLRVEARRRVVPLGQRRFWQTAYEYAVSRGGGRLDAVIEKYRGRSGS